MESSKKIVRKDGGSNDDVCAVCIGSYLSNEYPVTILIRHDVAVSVLSFEYQ